MKNLNIIVIVLLTAPYVNPSLADAYSYKDISRRHADVEFDRQTVKRARMEGECLAGLNKLQFNNRDEINQWAGYQASLLQQFSPCTVLIMLETAQYRTNRGGIPQ